MDSHDIKKTVHAETEAIKESLQKTRRDFHRYPEPGWCEFRSASIIARELSALGYSVKTGPDAITPSERFGLPDTSALDFWYNRALAEGADLRYMKPMKGGFTGITAVLAGGPGPVTAIRFDMDALEMPESTGPGHRPFREGFISQHNGVSHACGHDGHMAIGIGTAKVLMKLNHLLRGTVKLIFQPAEEGIRGAWPMITAGILEDVDNLIGLHLFPDLPSGHTVCGTSDFSATNKFDIRFTGTASHAGGAPEAGNNALMAASTAIMNMYAIPRHSGGTTRINVGTIHGGDCRNTICPEVYLTAETRGDTDSLNSYMYSSAERIIHAAAAMHRCSAEIIPAGSAPSAQSSHGLSQILSDIALSIEGLQQVPSPGKGLSEDFTLMMRHVQERGGAAAHIALGAAIQNEPLIHLHTPEFDFDEASLSLGVELLIRSTLALQDLPR